MRRLTLLTLLIAATLAPAAHADSGAVGIADDRLLFSAAGVAAVSEWAQTGIDVVRIHARWDRVAPAPGARIPPRGFRQHDPGDPAYRWAELDRAIKLVRGAGLRVMLAVTGPGPLWGTSDPSRGNPRLRPSPRAFAAFSDAVAQRYARDVDQWLIWNEPNQPAWLQPQRSRSGTLVAPHVYRSLVLAAVPMIRSADPGSPIAIGTLAPTGSTSRKANVPIKPLAFLRAFACVDSRLRPIRGGSCRGFEAPSADAFALHPHNTRSGPSVRAPDRDDLKLIDLPRAESLIDRLVARGRLAVTGGGVMPLWLTEFGYQTNPPDKFLGVSMAHQAQFLSQSAQLATADPRVENFVWYVWHDEPVAGIGNAGWQSGMYTLTNRPKPAREAFRFPFVVRRVGAVVTAWGQDRPGGAHRVAVTSAGRQVAVTETAPDGTFTVALPADSGPTWQAVDEKGMTSPSVGVVR